MVIKFDQLKKGVTLKIWNDANITKYKYNSTTSFWFCKASTSILLWEGSTLENHWKEKNTSNLTHISTKNGKFQHREAMK